MPLLSVENLTLLRQQLRRRWFQYQLEEQVLIGCISFSIEKATRLAFAREKHGFNYALCLAIMKLHEISEGTIHFAEVETRLLGGQAFSTPQDKDAGCVFRSVRSSDACDPGVVSVRTGCSGRSAGSIGGFLLLLMQCVYVAFYSRDLMGRLLVAGVVGLMFAHIYQNVGMNLLIMPITGIPFPLFSNGVTFMVVLLFIMGLVQSVWVHRVDHAEKKVAPRLRVDHLD